MASLLGKHKIEVDTTTVANGDSIASYLVDSAGTLLTSTLVGADQSLDVNVTASVLPTGAATQTTLAAVLTELQALSHAEDAAHVSGDLGIQALAVRNDAGTSLVSADGDYSPLSVDATGALRITGAISVTEEDVYPEDSAHVSGDKGAFNLGVRRDSRTSGTSADGDYASLNLNANGELWVHDLDVKTELVAANASLDAIESDADAIRVELLDQGTTLDSILVDTSAIKVSAAAIESDVDAIRVELLDQGTTLDSILADTATIDSNLALVLSEIQGLSHAEDAAHVSGDMGIQALAVRKDASGSNAADGDYTSFQTWSEGSLKVVDVANAAILQARVAVAATATAIPASALANRRSIMIQNAGAASIWIGSATVTASGATAGIEVPKGSFIEMEAGPAVTVYGITASGSVNVNVLQMS